MCAILHCIGLHTIGLNTIAWHCNGIGQCVQFCIPLDCIALDCIPLVSGQCVRLAYSGSSELSLRQRAAFRGQVVEAPDMSFNLFSLKPKTVGVVKSMHQWGISTLAFRRKTKYDAEMRKCVLHFVFIPSKYCPRFNPFQFWRSHHYIAFECQILHTIAKGFLVHYALVESVAEHKGAIYC